MSDPQRVATAVTLLGHCEAARRLVLSWPLVPAGLSRRKALVEWSRVSGVALAETQRLAEVLFAHALVREDRTVDAEATRVVQHVAAEQLRGAGRTRR
jgi:hypothetical protein